MITGRAWVALCLAVALGACVSAPQRPDPGPRLQLNGYSFASLNEPGWQLAGRAPARVVLGKPGTYPDETLIISAMLTRVTALGSDDSLADYVKAAEERDTTDRFKTLTHTVAPYTGLGARSHIVAEDRQPQTRSKRTGHMILEIASINCVHPDHPSVGVNITYSQRYYPGHQDPRFADKADRIFGTLEFAPVKASDH